MTTPFFELTPAERGSVLAVASARTGRDANLLEKDVWVVWTLDTLFRSPFGRHLIFKGGTSLSKVHKAISRFSEDVDVTYDIRELVQSAKDAGPDREPLPPTSSQARRWRDQVDEALPAWVDTEIAPLVRKALADRKLDARVDVNGTDLEIHYDSVTSPSAYVKNRILVEFGGRSTGEPSDEHDVTCDAEGHVDGVTFPTARPRTMRAERTFWEKATAVHGYCLGGALKGDAKARHWLDLHHLAIAGVATRAISDRELATQVASHKAAFFKVRTPAGQLDYDAAVNGGLTLVPQGEEAMAELAEDYARMVDARLPHDETAPAFDELMAHCARIAEQANTGASPPPDRARTSPEREA